MGIDQVVSLGRMLLEEVIILAGPVLVVAIAVSLFDRKPDAYTRALVDYIRHP